MSAEANSRPAPADRFEEIEWRDIRRPGCYLLIDTGDLIRFPAEALTPGAIPVIAMVSKSTRRLARISDDPLESVAVLRAIVKGHGYQLNF